MTVVLAGGTGFLGSRLRKQLERDGHRVVTLTRTPRAGEAGDAQWVPDGTAGTVPSVIDGADAVINLAGEGIADRRWTTARKAAIRSSRLLATRTLAAAIVSCRVPPKVFVSTSAVGYYGAHGDEPVTERTPPGHDFLARLCVDWEQEARAAQSAVTRVVVMRNGLVLAADAGALARMLPPFKLGLGATLGSGEQYMPWIHVGDWVDMTLWSIATDGAAGAFNATAPTPVTNREFTRTLSSVLKRPAVFRAPAFVLKTGLGELAHALLTGQRVFPAHADQLGFRFRFRQLDSALQDLL